jgi:probable rRNA maturation factor
VQVSADPGSSYLISVQIDEQYEDKLNCDALHKLALGVLHSEKARGPLEVGVVVTTDEEVLSLNRQYLGHDYKTDVLSFGMQEGHSSDDRVEFVTPQEHPAYLGDVVISYDRAAEQGPEYGQSTEAEVATLLIHGLLHLLGYDDSEEGARQRMHARQQELLEALYDPEC